MIQPYEIFLNIFNMSITASWLVLAIILIRLIFQKAPKAIFVALWALVAVRLICPFSIESVLSLVPNAQTIPMEFHSLEGAQLQENTVINIISNPAYQTSVSYELEQSADTTQLAFVSGYFVWLAGMAAMAIYTLISYLKLHKKVREAIPLKDNLMLCDSIDTPFILGFIKPKIYLPSAMNESDIQYVIAHEKSHLKRCDHLWKPLGFLLLTVYWFNPVLWLAYILLCRDIELACDEKVIKKLGVDIKKAYSQALINCSVKPRAIAACPLAFGETGVKKRIKSVLNYKKPAFWIIALVLVASIVVGVCFLTDPVTKNKIVLEQESASTLDGLSLEIVSSGFTQPSPYIEIEWINQTSNDITYGEEFYIYRQVDGEWVDCRTLENYVWTLEGYILNPYSTRRKQYSLNYISIDEPGRYRFESSGTIDSQENKEFDVWLEFEIDEAIKNDGLQLLTPVDMIYSDGTYSYVQTVDTAPSYLLSGNMVLHEITADSLITELGVMEETELDSKSFNSRFDSQSWLYPASKIKRNNRRMWELHCGSADESFEPLYILLQQKDGSFILGCGYYNCQSENPKNADDSHIRWLYKMSAEAFTDNTAINQSAVDGTILFYDTAVDEHAYIKNYSASVQLSDEELSKLLAMLESQKWISDALTDRVSFNFDGQLKYGDKWIYFGYEQRVIYCDEYFCEVSDETIDYIKAFGSNAEEFRPIEEISQAGTESTTATTTAPIATTQSPRRKTLTFNIDKDGNEELCVLSTNSTSEIFTFSLTAWENTDTSATPEYHNTFTIGSAFDLWFTDENGKVQIKAVSLSENPETEYYDIEVDENGWIALTFGNGKKRLSYHGTQGVEGYLQATKTYSGDLYQSSVAYANYITDEEFFAGSLNSVKLLINSVQHLPVYKFETYDELNSFKQRYKEVFPFDESWDEVPSFNEATAHMDKEFFEEYTLLLVYVTAPNSNLRFGVNSVYNDSENLCIHVEQTNNPDVLEDMMAGWFILVPVEKEQIQSCTAFDADLNNIPN